jgi:ribonuclease HI
MRAFSKKFSPPFNVSLALLSSYKEATPVGKSRILEAVDINMNMAWGFFEGACQGQRRICGLGFILFFLDSHFVTGKANMASGTKNQGELKALFALLKCDLSWDVLALQVMGDSKFTVDWMNDVTCLENLDLMALGQSLKSISALFHHFNYRHVYRDQNSTIDSLSKDALGLAENLMILEEFSGLHSFGEGGVVSFLGIVG